MAISSVIIYFILFSILIIAFINIDNSSNMILLAKTSIINDEKIYENKEILNLTHLFIISKSCSYRIN